MQKSYRLEKKIWQGILRTNKGRNQCHPNCCASLCFALGFSLVSDFFFLCVSDLTPKKPCKVEPLYLISGTALNAVHSLDIAESQPSSKVLDLRVS